MQVNADLHIHSRYSGATSDRMTIEALAFEAPRKGIQIMATGDCLNGNWLKEIRTGERIDDGTLEMNKTRFILTTEVEDNHRVHHLLFFPSFSAVEEFKARITPHSKNLETDGRPNVNLDGIALASLAKDVDALIGPAHAFTPWTAMYAYHSSLEHCYGDLASYISFVELGLSADTDYADTIQELHRLTFLTNSDSHSPHPVRIAREFTRFEVQDATFDEIKKAILRRGGNKPVLNVGLPPQEGKYNETACISCFTHYSLEEAVRRRWKCSCGKRIKKGVRDRIREIATYDTPHHPGHRPPYVHLIPLSEIIAKALGQHTPFTQTVSRRWEELITVFGSEISVLLDAELDKIAPVTLPAIVDAIHAFREHRVIIIPGGGGKYGTIELPSDEEYTPVSLGPKNSQTSLLDY
ncbi:MAG: TIGR00375 family protein [Candidatus Thermoplasmatota archaeon]|nr:TIGR00375 family protein [Candidatus Thermoplasmatota archaeon]